MWLLDMRDDRFECVQYYNAYSPTFVIKDEFITKKIRENPDLDPPRLYVGNNAFDIWINENKLKETK